MSKFKGLMLALLTIGWGVCTNSVVFGQYNLTGGDSTPEWWTSAGAATPATNLLASSAPAVEVIDNDSVERVSDLDLSSRTSTKRVAAFGSHVNTPGVTPSKTHMNAVRQASVPARSSPKRNDHH